MYNEGYAVPQCIMYNVKCIMKSTTDIQDDDAEPPASWSQTSLYIKHYTLPDCLSALPRAAGRSSKGYSFTPSFRLMSAILRRIYTDTPKMLPAYTKHCAM